MIVALYSATIIALAAQAAAPVAEAPKPQSDPITVTGKKICTRQMQTGSITPVRVCRTEAQTKEEARAQGRMRRQLDNIQRENDRCVAYPARCGMQN